MEKRFNKKFKHLETTINNFLKKLTIAKLGIMKSDLDRIKEVIKEKLGVEL